MRNVISFQRYRPDTHKHTHTHADTRTHTGTKTQATDYTKRLLNGCPLPWGPGTHLPQSPSTHMSQPRTPKMAHNRFRRFVAQLTRVPNTQTGKQTTLHATSVATGRIYALRGCDAA